MQGNSNNQKLEQDIDKITMYQTNLNHHQNSGFHEKYVDDSMNIEMKEKKGFLNADKVDYLI